MSDNHTCSATINDKKSRDIIRNMINSYPDEICRCRAKYFEDNEWYCGRHAPSKIEKREQESYRKWEEKLVKQGKSF